VPVIKRERYGFDRGARGPRWSRRSGPRAGAAAARELRRQRQAFSLGGVEDRGRSVVILTDVDGLYDADPRGGRRRS
jgi:hypothetical protein